MVVVRLGERGVKSYYLMGTASIWEDVKVVEMDSGNYCTTM